MILLLALSGPVQCQTAQDRSEAVARATAEYQKCADNLVDAQIRQMNVETPTPAQLAAWKATHEYLLGEVRAAHQALRLLEAEAEAGDDSVIDGASDGIVLHRR